MKTNKSRLKLPVLLLMLSVPAITFYQGGLLRSWKYVSQGGRITCLDYDGTLYAASF